MMLKTAVICAMVLMTAPAAYAQDGLLGTVVHEHNAKEGPIPVLAGGTVSIALDTALRYKWVVIATRNMIPGRPMREIEPKVAEGVVGYDTTSVFEMVVTRPGPAMVTMQYRSPENVPEKTVTFNFVAR